MERHRRRKGEDTGKAVKEEKRSYPIRADDYELYEVVGEGKTATVHRALCLPFDEIVAVKIIDIEKDPSDLSNISHEAKTMLLSDHPNVLKAHCSFVSGHSLWIVMPYMAAGSCFHIMKSTFPNGFEEDMIATVLNEALKGLSYLHENGHIHRDIKAGNILVDADGGVKLGDFGVSVSVFDSGHRNRAKTIFVGTPSWMAPEVLYSEHGYDFRADIWSFGITALELAYGHAPFSQHPPGKVFLTTLYGAPPSLENKGGRKFSSAFKYMIASCLVKDPSRRPSAKKLLMHNFFAKHAKTSSYIMRKIVERLPPLGDRFQALKLKEEELFAQKKILDEEKETMSQNEYKRGISAWNFDVDKLKLMATLISDNEGLIPSKGQEGCSSSSFEHNSGVPMDGDFSLKEYDNLGTDTVMMQKDANLHHSPYQTAKYQSCDAFEIEPPVTISNDQDALGSDKHFCASDINLLSPKESSMQHAKIHNEGSNGVVSQISKDMPNDEAIPKAFKSEVASNHYEKAKPTMVQQKGRFKVTSENVDQDKELLSPSPQRTRSFQLEATHDMEKELVHDLADLQSIERERELMQDIADLESRLTSAHGELQKLQHARNARV